MLEHVWVTEGWGYAVSFFTFGVRDSLTSGREQSKRPARVQKVIQDAPS